jgi:phasin family protein
MITPESFASSNKALVDTLVTLANTALAAAEQVVALNAATARSFVQDSASNTKALLSAQTPQEAMSIQASLAQPGVETAVAYSRSLYEIASKAQEALSAPFVKR